MVEIDVKIKLALEQPPDQSSKEALADGMDAELSGFNEWFRTQGNAPLVAVERSILKTYLAWKLLYEAGCPAPQA